MGPCDRSLVKKIFEDSEIFLKNNNKIVIKNIPDSDKKGVFDDREYSIRKAIYDFRKMFPVSPDLDAIRKNTRSYCLDLNEKEVKESEVTLHVEDREVKVYVYEPAERTSERSSAFVYIHGGSFMSSSAAYYASPCRYITEKAGSVCFNIEYSLAPENKYPDAIVECIALLQYVHDNADKYGIDPERVALGGDSAGCNLGIGAVIDCPEEIRPFYMALFYPCVDLFSGDGLYEWNETDYDIDDSQRELILSRLSLGRFDGKGNMDLMINIFQNYMGSRYEELKRKPDVSPVYADLSIMPKTHIFSAEFDALREQDEYYAQRLTEYGVENTLFRYRGVSHAFLDYFGILPQAEAAVMEIVEQLKMH